MKNLLSRTALVALILATGVGTAHAAGEAHAANYVQFKPMSQVVTEGVRDCRGGEGKNVPLITWGADMVTIFGNGNSLTTQPGSIFANEGLSLTLNREDVFAEQVAAFLRCDTPYLRGTMDQLALATDVTEGDSRTEMVVVYQHSWSNGGDAIVAKGDISSPGDLRGKTIAVQNQAPQIAYLFRVLKDAGVGPNEVNIVWTEDLVGFDSDSTPGVAFMDDDTVSAAVVIIPDALALTSGGMVGTGAEGSVSGATIMVSTKSANRIIADVYAVRRDYFEAHKVEVQKFVHGLFVAEEKLLELVRNKGSRAADYDEMITAAANYLLDAPTAIGDAEGLYADAETAGYPGNKQFFNDSNYPRRFGVLSVEIQTAYIGAGLLTTTATIATAGWDYTALAAGVANTAVASAPKFDNEKLTAAVTSKATTSGLDDTTLVEFQINFQPNQNDFPVADYAMEFKKVVDLAATYGGAVITIEGHSDPLGYLKQARDGLGKAILNRTEQAAINLSMSRAQAVRDTIIRMATDSGFSMDPSQFVVIGHGIKQPLTGICGDDPCAPKNEVEWLSNMRVVFKLVNIEAESSGFVALD